MKISVIIPVYNTKEYLKECIDSILNQTIDLFEVIIVDDGSTDGSLELINQYAESHSNIRVISQKNCGPGAARNIGLKISKGEYIYFIDSDDILEKNALEYCYNLASKNKLDMLTFEADILGNIEGENIEQYMFHKKIDRIGEVLNGVDFIEENYYKVSLLNIPFTIYLRDFLIKNTLFFLEQTMYEDVDFYHKIIRCNPKMEIIDNIFYHRRYRQNSIMTSKVTETSIMNKINIYESVITNSSDKLMKLYYMIGIRGIRKALQECKKNKISLEKKYIYEILKFIKSIDINICNLSILLDMQFCFYYVDDNLKKEEEYNNKIYTYIHDTIGNLHLISQLYDEYQVIGIYGNSDDCKLYLDIIRKTLGDFKCKFIYIQTRTNEMEKKNNIYNIKELNNIYMDAIIIGSVFFEDQIKDQIKKYARLSMTIYSLKNDLGYYKL